MANVIAVGTVWEFCCPECLDRVRFSQSAPPLELLCECGHVIALEMEDYERPEPLDMRETRSQ